jgi:hypothetical protein
MRPEAWLMAGLYVIWIGWHALVARSLASTPAWPPPGH